MAMRSYINCLASPQCSWKEMRSRKGGSLPFFYFFLLFFFGVATCGEAGREEVEQNLNEVGKVGGVRDDRQRKWEMQAYGNIIGCKMKQKTQ